MTVIIGNTEIDNILNWDEDEAVPIPKKKILRKATPTTQSGMFHVDPRFINISIRATRAFKETLRGLKNAHIWYHLCDYDCVGVCDENNDAFVDFVWIEHLGTKWQGEKDKNFPWLVTLNLVCSTT